MSSTCGPCRAGLLATTPAGLVSELDAGNAVQALDIVGRVHSSAWEGCIEK